MDLSAANIYACLLSRSGTLKHFVCTSLPGHVNDALRMLVALTVDQKEDCQVASVLFPLGRRTAVHFSSSVSPVAFYNEQDNRRINKTLSLINAAKSNPLMVSFPWWSACLLN